MGAVARRVMIVGTKRATQYGYSLYEVEVSGSPATDRPDDSPLVPSRFALYEAYPNPFNPAANLCYDLPGRATVQVSVHSVLGQELRTVIQAEQEAGRQFCGLSMAADWQQGSICAGSVLCAKGASGTPVFAGSCS